MRDNLWDRAPGSLRDRRGVPQRGEAVASSRMAAAPLLLAASRAARWPEPESGPEPGRRGRRAGDGGYADERPLESRSNAREEPSALDGCAGTAMQRGSF